MNNADTQYLDLMQDILDNGRVKGDRTGTGTKSVFGRQIRFDLTEGFPLLTTKKVHLASIIHELLWFLKGDTNNNTLKDAGVKIWDAWAAPDGDLGPIYGAMWRSWPTTGLASETIDQIAIAIDQLKNNPNSRRILVSGWNPELLPNDGATHLENIANGKQVLPPCHTLFQFMSEEMTLQERLTQMSNATEKSERVKISYWLNSGLDTMSFSYNDLDGVIVHEESLSDVQLVDVHDALDSEGVARRFLSCQLYQRSADVFLGVPFNIASYALLTMMVAQVTGHVAKDFVHTFGDAHLYLNHQDQVLEQLSRRTRARDLPTIKIMNERTSIDDFHFGDFKLENYNCHPAIKAPISI